MDKNCWAWKLQRRLEWHRQGWASRQIDEEQAIQMGTPLIPLREYTEKYFISRSGVIGLIKAGRLLGKKQKNGRVFIVDRLPDGY